ncbi:DUF1028 domain-containing protein [Bosea sp. SSUT16]|jgi:uncharacterized Ntn-hydrolase superfamily protein|uniref:DUF1028 domain-containing protein n=1 Tax=Bosea spartocytisi TaxID=2773451 RepID=A0A927I1A9_9HYPH|nr:DUF1028 domain-containing protein [Bosea spartocytisi]MBD3848159.1 DUF1028 domain-containing protein [Bosea spartocytisi]MCT4474009.1 DUF1028 domain-containing protein [Bosea spartocytisi]
MNIDLTQRGNMLSVLARDPADGTLGIALASSSIAIGARCPHVETGRAAVASQGFTNLKVGPLALDLIRCGLTAAEVLEALRQHDRWLDYRQIGILTADGQIGAHTGSQATGWADHRISPDLVVLGNGLTQGSAALDAAMSGYADDPASPMAKRLLTALERTKTLLVDSFPINSASLLVRSPGAESQIDLRVDLPTRPIEDGGNALADLARLYEAYRPLVEIYAARSVAPRSF